MNKTELVAAMADQAGLSKKDAEKALNLLPRYSESTLKTSYSPVYRKNKK